MVDCYVVDITENALKDLEGHMDYLIEKEGDPDKAISLSDLVDESITKLKENPYRAQKYLSGRKFKIPKIPYCIYMQIREKERTVIITNIYHDRQNRPL
jgi:plasmid stabilization system protein ParE